MLVIDENMFKLAKMQEALLKVSGSNKEENLKKYQKTVSEIDSKAFNDILEEINHIEEHNQSLEEELQFLERIKEAYDQLLQLQLGFKKNCELYGNMDLVLSDLSRLNIDYIDSRINAIKGYLINLKNIEVNKDKLQKLNIQLIDEENKKVVLNKKLLDMEKSLKNNFLLAEGRCIVSDGLQYTSVTSEYEKIGLDFKRLLSDSESLNDLLSEVQKEYNEMLEKVKAAELCYNNMLTSESRQVLEEINLEFLRVRYKLVMLKIVNLLSQDCNNYELFVEKRKNLLDLIKYRASYIESLGIKNTIDPFGRTKVTEQLDSTLSVADNTKVINNLRKEIGQLGSWTEEMLSQNNNYLITLSDTKNLIESKVGLNDIDIGSVVSFDDILVKQEIASNQVLSVKSTSSKFNMSIVKQKTASVIKRVNQMVNKEVPVITSVDEIEKHEDSEIVPELVIVPSDSMDKVEGLTNDSNLMFEENNDVSFVLESPLEIVSDTKTESKDSKIDDVDNVVVPEFQIIGSDEIEKEMVVAEKADDISMVSDDDTDLVNDDSGMNVTKPIEFDLFETVTPFESPELFSDKVEDNTLIDKLENLKTDVINNSNDLLIEFPETTIKSELDNEMPEAFWVTQGTGNSVIDDEDNAEISFDEQISALLSSENSNVVKSRKM